MDFPVLWCLRLVLLMGHGLLSPLQPEIAPLNFRHPSVIVMPHEALDYVLGEKRLDPLESARCQRIRARHPMGLQDVLCTPILVPLDLWPQQLVSAVRLAVERLARARQESLAPVNRKLLAQDLLLPWLSAEVGK